VFFLYRKNKMAASDDLFKNISMASKQATDELKKTIEEFKRLQNLAGRINPQANRIPSPSNFSAPSAQIQSHSIQAAINNMQQIHAARVATTAPAFRLPYNTTPVPPVYTPSGIGHVDSVLGSVQRGMPGGILYRRAMDLARNSSIDPAARADALGNLMDISRRRGGVLNQEQLEKLTYGPMSSLRQTANKNAMQAEYHKAMNEKDMAKRASMLENIVNNSPIKTGREYEFVKRGYERARQGVADSGFTSSIRSASSPSQLAELRTAALGAGASNQILDRIDRKLEKMANLAERQQKEKDQRFRNVMTAGGSAAIGVAKALGGAAWSLGTQNISAPINAFQSQASYENAVQRRFAALGEDFSGEGRLRAAGSYILAGRADTPFLGVKGFDKALNAAQTNITQLGQRSIMGDLAKTAFGGLLAIGGGALALTGAGTPLGLAAMASGGGMVAGGINSLASNQALRATGVFGSSLKAEAENARTTQAYLKGLELQQSEMDRMYIYGRQIDATESQNAANRESIARMGAKGFTMRPMDVMGGGVGPTFTLQESLAYAKMSPMQQEMYLNNRLASNLGKGNSSWDRATALGMTSDEYTSAVSRTQTSLGVGGGGGEATANQLIRMSRSGYGSFEQLLGNMGTLSGISGKANSLGDLKAILGAAVASGFDGSRLGQKFVETTGKLASSLGLMDVSRLGTNLGAMARNFGMGERGLTTAAASLDAFNKAATNNPLTNTLIDARLAATGNLSNPTAYSLAHLSPTKQYEIAQQISQVKRGTLSSDRASLEAQQYIYGAGGASGALKSMRGSLAASMPFLSSRPELLEGARGKSGAVLRKYLMTPSIEVNGRNESILDQIMKMEGMGDVNTAMAAFQSYAIAEGVITPQVKSAGTGAANLYSANNLTARAKAQFSNQLARSGMGLLGQTLAQNVGTAGVANSAIGKYISDFATNGTPVTIGGALFSSTKDVESAMKLTSKSDSELMQMTKNKDTAADAARALALKDTTVNAMAIQAQVESGAASGAQLVRLDPTSITSLAMALAGTGNYEMGNRGRLNGR
jgi:hypothetical protein